MVINKTEHSDSGPAKQGLGKDIGEPNKIGASTPYDFEGKNLTAYGGLLPVATMLEKLGFQQLVEETLTVKRATRAMPMYQFVLGLVLAMYGGFSRLHHLRFLEREPMSDRHSEGVAFTAAMHLVAFSRVAASGHRAATAGGAA